KRVTGDVIESVWLGSKPEPLKSSAREIESTLRGKRIAGVRRVGKHIVIDLEASGVARTLLSANAKRQIGGWKKSDLAGKNARPTSPAQWIVHLGMPGQMLVCQASAEIAKHTHAIAHLKSGRELRFVDPRRFGRLSVTHDFQAPGSEPLAVELDRFV